MKTNSSDGCEYTSMTIAMDFKNSDEFYQSVSSIADR